MIVGIDEVGRGCWAGPLVAGAVVLNEPVDGLTDSKLLSKVKRDHLASIIYERANVGLGWVSAREIDTIGLTAAVRLAMRRALKQVTVPYTEIIVDGTYNFLATLPTARAVIKADLTVPAVSAASIVAKVARDNYMASLPKRYAQYNFGSHVGYGTTAHRQALQTYGVSDLHRRSYRPIQALLQ